MVAASVARTVTESATSRQMDVLRKFVVPRFNEAASVNGGEKPWRWAGGWWAVEKCSARLFSC